MNYKSGASGDVRARQWAVGADFPIGSGSIKASYAKADDLAPSTAAVTAVSSFQSTAAAQVGAQTGARMWSLGYEHRFSKRTNVGLGFAKIDNGARAGFTWTGAPPNQNGTSNSPITGSNVSTLFLSMRHRF